MIRVLAKASFVASLLSIANVAVGAESKAAPVKPVVESPDLDALDDEDKDSEATRHSYQYTLIGMDRREYLLGGVTATVIGYGLGHAVQGRYWQEGWIYTAGELLANLVTLASVAPCRDDFFSTSNISTNKRLDKCNKAGLVLGPMVFMGFRIGETIDAWLTPNPDLKDHLFNQSRRSSRLEFAYVPSLSQGLGEFKVSYRF